jgi:hypothetical protein
MRRKCILLGITTCFVVSGLFSQIPFKSGNIVVSRIGDGSIPLSNASAPVFLDEYTPSGTLIQSIPMPTSANGANKTFTLEGFSADLGELTGLLNLSPNGQWISAAGFDAPLLTPNTFLQTDANINRTIGIIDYNGSVNTATSLSDADLGYPFAATTSNNSDLWICYKSGINYAVKGNSTSTNLISSTLYRYVNISNNQLFSTVLNGAIRSIGTGLPTSGSPSTITLPGISTASLVTNQFFFADLDANIPGNDVVYLTHQILGLKKYSFDGASWVDKGVIGGDSDDYLGITGVVVGTTVTLYCTRNINVNSPNGGGELVVLTDASGQNGSFTGTPVGIKSASFQTAIRGVVMAPQPLSISLSTKAFLQGAYNSTIGRHKNVTTTWAAVLNASALNQPYNVAPFNYAGTESVSNGFFTADFTADDGVTTDIVDWVLVELHDATTPTTIIARKACFIREDGQIVDLDKTTNPTFTGVGANNYYVVIKHRNHLPIRSATTVFVNGATPITYDFTTAQSQAYQNGAVTTNAAMKEFTGVFCMWAGNVNANNNTKYTGPQNDALALLAQLSANQAAIVQLPGGDPYKGGDVNMDGVIRYTGPNNDALALLAVLSANQAAVINEHQ